MPNRLIRNVVFFGSSIEQYSMCDRIDETEAMFRRNGVYVKVHDYATAGNRLVDWLARYQAVITAFGSVASETCITYMCVSGNDVTDTRPYSAATQLAKDTIANGSRTILQAFVNAGFMVVPANTSYRAYPGMGAEANGSLPYNQNITHPLIQELCPHAMSNGVPVVDAYTFFKNNPSYLKSDGIHPTDEEGEYKFMEYWVNRMSPLIHNSKQGDNHLRKVLINCGNNNIQGTTNRIAANGVIMPQLQVDGSTLEGLSITTTNTQGINTGGRGNTGNTSLTLKNHMILQDSLNILDSAGSVKLVFSGPAIGLDRKYRLSLACSRNANDQIRRTIFTIAGKTMMLDASLNPPPEGFFELWGYELLHEAGLQFKGIGSPPGTTYGYLGGFMIELLSDPPHSAFGGYQHNRERGGHFRGHFL